MSSYTHRELLSVPRDLKLIREILLVIENGALTLEELDIDGYNRVEVHAHVRMLSKAGFLGSQPQTDPHGLPHGMFDLSWEARELLDNLRDEKTFQKVQEHIGETVRSASINVIAEVAGSFVRGIALGGAE